MAWTDPRTWTIGELVTKAILDTHIRDNLNFLKGAIDAGLNYLRRQGNSATNWTSAGTTTYTPTAPLVQMGSASVTLSNQSTAAFTITFPIAYANPPLLFVSKGNISAAQTVTDEGRTSNTSSGFGYTIRYAANNNETVVIAWLAIGE